MALCDVILNRWSTDNSRGELLFSGLWSCLSLHEQFPSLPWPAFPRVLGVHVHVIPLQRSPFVPDSCETDDNLKLCRNRARWGKYGVWYDSTGWLDSFFDTLCTLSFLLPMHIFPINSFSRNKNKWRAWVYVRMCVCVVETRTLDVTKFRSEEKQWIFFNTDYIVFNRIFGNEMTKVFNFEF